MIATPIRRNFNSKKKANILYIMGVIADQKKLLQKSVMFGDRLTDVCEKIIDHFNNGEGIDNMEFINLMISASNVKQMNEYIQSKL